jgi:predicted mannosyl-3-phosphoglycerate phosphatase (HAD superfamily)
MYKVIFLDIDGVLNHVPGTPSYTDESGYFHMTDPEKVFMINKLEELGITIVLSSSWRHMLDWEKTMRANGLLFVKDRTPTKVKNSKCRGSNIQAWLDLHPEVDRYAILDDQGIDDFLPNQIPNLFQTNSSVGLTDGIMGKIIKHLME